MLGNMLHIPYLDAVGNRRSNAGLLPCLHIRNSTREEGGDEVMAAGGVTELMTLSGIVSK